MVKILEEASISPEINEILNELKKDLKGKFDVEEIILYGSVSRGEADDESDIDLLIITSSTL